MFLCNTSAIKDWNSFLSQILPLMNKSAAGSVSFDAPDTVTAATVTALLPDGAVSASSSPLNSDHTSGMEHVFQYSGYSESDLLFRDYQTPGQDPIPLPKAVLYLVMAALVMVAVAYAIVGHLVKDVLNDFVGGGSSVVTEGARGEASEPDWPLGSRRVSSCNKNKIHCITGMASKQRERPHLVEMRSINRPEEVAVIVDETLDQRPPEAPSGT
ncbi:uncharacterized protein LOC117519463 [Thalassophryne amazonica]|uniref:uncharacterized protein LOC117519463 n=1 Tax=Thalassophryne amazonica TaxID=390379 RepID=UPI0014708BFA|nr:uncharacterized protein LOC117519463 [Thalassophryne amazonica]